MCLAMTELVNKEQDAENKLKEMAAQLKVRFEELAILTSMLEASAAERLTSRDLVRDDGEHGHSAVSDLEQKLARELEIRQELASENSRLLIEIGNLSERVNAQTDEIAALTAIAEQRAQEIAAFTEKKAAKARSRVNSWFELLPWKKTERAGSSNKQKKVTDDHLIRNSGFFDEDWYFQKYGGEKFSKRKSLNHFMSVGWQAGNDPGPRFSVTWYMEKYPDVASSGLNPLVHYLKFGQKENRIIKGS